MINPTDDKTSKSTTYVGLNFSVTPEFRKAFKTWCAMNDVTLVAALAEAFELLKASRAGKNGTDRTENI